MDIYNDFGPDSTYGEDGNSCIRRKLVSVADIIDNFYDEIKAENIDSLESVQSALPNVGGLYNYLHNFSSDLQLFLHKIEKHLSE